MYESLFELGLLSAIAICFAEYHDTVSVKMYGWLFQFYESFDNTGFQPISTPIN